MAHRSLRPWFLTAAAVVTLAAALLPELTGLGWHVLHGSEARLGDWRVPVPTGWFAVRQGEALTLERMQRLALWDPPPTVVFLPVHLGPQAQFDPGIWSRVQGELQARRGYRLAATLRRPMAGHIAFCWEFLRVGQPTRWWITCLVPEERLSADFSGQQNFIEDFYRILPGIHRAGDNAQRDE